MYSSIGSYVNTKTLPPLSRTTGSRPSQEKSGAYPHSSSRNRSGSDLRAESQRYLGSTPKRRSGGELPHVLHGCMARQEKTNRGQQPGETGQHLWGPRFGNKTSGNSRRARPAGKPKAIGRKQAWFSLAGCKEFECIGAWNGGLK